MFFSAFLRFQSIKIRERLTKLLESLRQQILFEELFVFLHSSNGPKYRLRTEALDLVHDHISIGLIVPLSIVKP